VNTKTALINPTTVFDFNELNFVSRLTEILNSCLAAKSQRSFRTTKYKEKPFHDKPTIPKLNLPLIRTTVAAISRELVEFL
jgi:hypothetical protein